MLAARSATAPPPDSQSSAEQPALRAAGEDDAAAASPVHTLQAELAEAFDQPSALGGFDPIRLIIVLFNGVCWWGLISLSAAWVHALARR